MQLLACNFSNNIAAPCFLTSRPSSAGFLVLPSVILGTHAGPANFNGLNPSKLPPFNDPSKLGLSHDPEGLAVGRDGSLYISDEYGPSVYEFGPDGR